MRLSLRLRDSAHAIYVRYEGLLRVDAASHPQLMGQRNAASTRWGQHEWFMSPVFETSDPDLKWIEEACFVGEGRWVVEKEKGSGEQEIGVEYQIFRLRGSGKG